MYYETTKEQVQSAISILKERGYKILKQNDYKERGYQIETHCFRNGKNECFKPKNGSLYKFGLLNNHFSWIRVAKLEYIKPKKDYRAEAYQTLKRNQKNSL